MEFRFMQKSQKGFTLIELVVVIVLLGILGVTALGKFQNLSAQAADAAEQGIGGEISSASAINFAARTLTATAGSAITTATCTAAGLGPLMASGSVPTTNYSYAYASGDVVDGAACTSGQTFSCSIINSQGSDLVTGAIASLICIP